MKYYKHLIPFLLFCIAFYSHAQQVQQLWTQAVPNGVAWQMNTSLGNYVVGTNQGLKGLNPDNGQVLWNNNSIGPVSIEQVQQIGSSALLSINAGSDIYILDPFSGDIKFNSQSAGIAEIKDQQVLYLSNGILVSGRDVSNKDILLMSSLENGEVLWKIQDDYGRFVTASEVSPEELLIVTVFYNYKINPASGEVIWKNDVSDANKQLANLGAFGGLLKQAAANAVQDMEMNVQFYLHPTKDIFYVASEQEGSPESSGGFTTTTTTGSGPSYHTTYSAFDLNNGDRIWEKPLDLSGKIGGVYFDENGLVIMPNDGSNTKINSYNYDNKEGQWGKKGRGINIKGGIYSYSEVNGGLVLVSQNASGKNFLSYLDLQSATLTFDKPVQIDGELVDSELLANGMYYQTSEEINILDITSGKLILDKGIQTVPSLTVHREGIAYIFDLKENSLKILDKATFSIKTMSDEIAFEGKEIPNSIEVRNNGILISSSQNIALVDFDGKTIYQAYFEAPREPGIIRALQYAQAVRAAYISAAAYSASAAFQSAGQQANANNEAGTGVILEGIGSAYGELGDAGADFAKKSFQAANARYKATQNAEDFTIVLTKQDKNNILMKVNKNTGQNEGIIDLGKDTTPNYTMDGVTGQVFYAPDANQIIGFQL